MRSKLFPPTWNRFNVKTLKILIHAILWQDMVLPFSHRILCKCHFLSTLVLLVMTHYLLACVFVNSCMDTVFLLVSRMRHCFSGLQNLHWIWALKHPNFWCCFSSAVFDNSCSNSEADNVYFSALALKPLTFYHSSLDLTPALAPQQMYFCAYSAQTLDILASIHMIN